MGPNTPKYGPDVERFFADHPHVDIAVHGEGEADLRRAPRRASGSRRRRPGRLSALARRAGLELPRPRRRRQHRHARSHRPISTPSRRPILTGLFDGFIPAGPLGGVALETNRGCPYGCTFCDWGSATLSRVRKFDLDRVFAELEWCAKNQIQTVGIADANFGIFERDVEIAEKIAELKATYGYPKIIGNNYAKNTVKHLSKIIEIFTEAGIVAEGKMSMQTFDDETLTIIRRKNIKVEKYDELSVEFRRNGLPLSVDLMLGLPGSTPETFRNDLQACVDRDVRAIDPPTMLLPNSPMNEPEYREEHGIMASPGEYVKETASYTRAEWDQMHRLGAGFWLFENFGILRQVAGYVRGETGRREVDFYEPLIEASDRSGTVAVHGHRHPRAPARDGAAGELEVLPGRDPTVAGGGRRDGRRQRARDGARRAARAAAGPRPHLPARARPRPRLRGVAPGGARGPRGRPTTIGRRWSPRCGDLGRAP